MIQYIHGRKDHAALIKFIDSFIPVCNNLTFLYYFFSTPKDMVTNGASLRENH